MTIKRAKVDSSAVHSIGFEPDPAKPGFGTLAVEYTSGGGVYHYFDVPAEHHAGLMASSSKGRYLHTHIRGFSFSKEG